MGSAEECVFETNPLWPLCLDLHIIEMPTVAVLYIGCADSCNTYVVGTYVEFCMWSDLKCDTLQLYQVSQVNIKHGVHEVIRWGMSVDFNHVLHSLLKVALTVTLYILLWWHFYFLTVNITHVLWGTCTCMWLCLSVIVVGALHTLWEVGSGHNITSNHLWIIWHL